MGGHSFLISLSSLKFSVDYLPMLRTYTFMLYFLALWKKNYGVYNFTLGCCLEISSGESS